MKSFKKKKCRGGWDRAVGGCEPRIEVIVESKKKSEGACPGLGDWMAVTQDKKRSCGGTG